MNIPLKNPFGLKDGVLITVDDVPAGVECGCTCPSCGARLVAKHGASGRQSHFAHYNAEDCGVSYESAAHIFAKEVLAETKTIILPYLDIESSTGIQIPGTFRAKKRLVNRQAFQFDTAELEVRIDGRIPDVVLSKSERKLLVEIEVTHGITPEKLEWIRRINIATISVNLTWTNPATLQSELRSCLRSGRSPHGFNVMHWVHHPWQQEEQVRIDADYLKSVHDGTVERPQAPVHPSHPSPPAKRDPTLFD